MKIIDSRLEFHKKKTIRKMQDLAITPFIKSEKKPLAILELSNKVLISNSTDHQGGNLFQNKNLITAHNFYFHTLVMAEVSLQVGGITERSLTDPP